MDISRATAKLFVSNTGSAMLTFLGTVLFAHEIGATELGIFFLFQTAIGFLSLAGDLGIRGAIEKRISEGESEKAMLSTGTILKAGVLTIICVGIFLVEDHLKEFLNSDLTVLLVIGLVLTEFTKLMTTALKAELRVGDTAVFTITRKAIWVGGGLVLLQTGLEARALVYSWLAGFVVSGVWAYHRVSLDFGRPSITCVHSIFKYSRYNFLAAVNWELYNWLDIAVIGTILGPAAVGVYEIAWRVTSFVTMLNQAIGRTIFPQISAWNAESSMRRIETTVSSLITPSVFLVVPAFFGSVLYAEEILGYIFGTEYTAAALVLVVLMAEKVAYGVNLLFQRVIEALDRPDLVAQATLITMILNLTLNVALVSHFGIIGGAIATLTASVVSTALHTTYIRKLIRLRIPYRMIGVCIASALGMTLVLIVFRQQYHISSLPELLAAVTIGVVVYLLVTVSFPQFRSEIRHQLNEIW